MATSVRWTISDLEGLPQPLDDKRYEIIDGELHVTSQPSWHHQATCRNVLRLLDNWSRPLYKRDLLESPLLPDFSSSVAHLFGSVD